MPVSLIEYCHVTAHKGSSALKHICRYLHGFIVAMTYPGNQLYTRFATKSSFYNNDLARLDISKPNSSCILLRHRQYQRGLGY